MYRQQKSPQRKNAPKQRQVKYSTILVKPSFFFFRLLRTSCTKQGGVIKNSKTYNNKKTMMYDTVHC